MKQLKSFTFIWKWENGGEFIALCKGFVNSLAPCHNLVCRNSDDFLNLWDITFVYYIYDIVLIGHNDQEIAHTIDALCSKLSFP